MSDKEITKEVINAFFKAAGITHGWQGSVNEKVAAVFGTILEETRHCSAALAWVPRPTGRATISWVAKQLGSSFIREIQGKTSFLCAKTVIYKWRRALDMAAAGI